MDLTITKRANTNEIEGLLRTTILLSPYQVEIFKIALPEFGREWRLNGIAVVREDEVLFSPHQTLEQMTSIVKEQQNKLIDEFWNKYDEVERIVKLVKNVLKVLKNHGAGE